MVFNTNQIAISTTAITVVVASTERTNLVLKNTGTDIVYIGSDNSVTASNGFPLDAGETYIDTDYAGIYYGICDTGDSSTIMFLEEDN